jgi:hypothetical protein
VLGQEPMKGRELRVLTGLIAAPGVERVAEDDHREFAARLLERRAEPGQLIPIDAPAHARVHREQGKALGLDLKVGSALKAGGDPVFAAQPRGLLHQPRDAAVGGAGEPVIGLDPRPHRDAGGIGDEKGGHEAFQRVVPVVIAGNGVDRSVEPLERQPEIRLIVDHRPRRVDDVRRDDHEAHVGPGTGPEDLIAQDVLGGVALARIADHQEREVSGNARWVDGERARRRRSRRRRHDRPGHGRPPGVGAILGPGVVDRGGPVLGVEVPVHAPDGDRGHGDRDDGQAHL